MRPTLIAIHHLQIGAHAFTHGAEITPRLIDEKTLAKLLDQGRVRECPERRSLHRLFSVFSACDESEPLDAELIEFTLPK